MISQGPLRFEAAIFFYLEHYSDLNFALLERIRHLFSDARYDNFIWQCDLFRYIDVAYSIIFIIRTLHTIFVSFQICDIDRRIK